MINSYYLGIGPNLLIVFFYFPLESGDDWNHITIEILQITIKKLKRSPVSRFEGTTSVDRGDCIKKQ